MAEERGTARGRDEITKDAARRTLSFAAATACMRLATGGYWNLLRGRPALSANVVAPVLAAPLGEVGRFVRYRVQMERRAGLVPRLPNPVVYGAAVGATAFAIQVATRAAFGERPLVRGREAVFFAAYGALTGKVVHLAAITPDGDGWVRATREQSERTGPGTQGRGELRG